MRRPGWRLVVWAAVASAAVCAWAAAPAARGLLAEGTRWQTPYYVVDSGRPGPTVLLTAGLHGNEPAGACAADQVRHWPLARGRLVVVPRANAPGLAEGTRGLPGEPRDARDANRNFPRTDGPDEATGTLCQALWAFVTEQRPDWHVDLHEGYGYRGAGSKSAGSSIIRWPDPEAREAQRRTLEAVNATVDDPRKKLVALRRPADGSLARACAQRLGAHALLCETTWRADPSGEDKKSRQPLALRIRQHRLMVHALLAHLEMAACEADRMLPPREAGGGLVRVAVYNGPGAATKHFLRLREVLGRCGDVAVCPAGPGEVRGGALGQFDVAVFPGGSGSAQARGLGEEGRERVRRFVEAGGGYVGLCAGAYLATCGYSWSLGILDAVVVDRAHWRRGTGTVEVELSPAGRRLLAAPDGSRKLYYANGPLLAAAGKAELPDFTALAHYRSEVAERGAPKGVMVDTPAIVSAPFGRGRVVVFGPHPESPKSPAGAEALLVAALRWCARGACEDARTGRARGEGAERLFRFCAKAQHRESNGQTAPQQRPKPKPRTAA